MQGFFVENQKVFYLIACPKFLSKKTTFALQFSNMEKGIKSWSETDRPREKMVEKGVLALSDSELIAILLASGNADETAVDLARRILKDCDNNLQKFSKHSIKSLSEYKGIGIAKAVTLLAAIELGNRRFSELPDEKRTINCSEDAYRTIYPYLNNRTFEEFWIILLDIKKQIINIKEISSGSTAFTIVDVKKLLKIALEGSASFIILCHNHPSGILIPSQEDQHLTQKIKEASQIIDIKLIDHIIVGDERFYSFSDNNEL